MRELVQSAHSALQPSSAEAVRIAALWWWMLAVGAVVWVCVIAAMLWSIRSRNRNRQHAADGNTAGDVSPVAAILSPEPDREQSLARIVSWLTAATTVVLLVFLAMDFKTGRDLRASPGSSTIDIDVVGHQWWWELTYDKNSPRLLLVTANEMHVPVGTTVKLSLHSADVIHSLWFPNMQGKRDMIPGHESVLQFRADTAGTYLGECAEFCGLQHAKMRMVLVAESRSAFEAWLAAERSSSAIPVTEVARFGQQVFTARSCATCHGIRGTTAGHVAPDLTHIASRGSLASGALPNTPENLTRWIVAPQLIKPGTQMPSTSLPDAELRALVTYLGTLR